MPRLSSTTCLRIQNLRRVIQLSNLDLDQNGRFYQFLRSERKRTYRKIEIDNSEKSKILKKLKTQNLQLKKELYEMRDQVGTMKQCEEATEDYRMKILKLIEEGVLDENGELIRSSSDE